MLYKKTPLLWKDVFLHLPFSTAPSTTSWFPFPRKRWQASFENRCSPIPIPAAPSGAPRLVFNANGITFDAYRDPSLSLRMTVDGGAPRFGSPILDPRSRAVRRPRSRSQSRSSTLDPSTNDSPVPAVSVTSSDNTSSHTHRLSAAVPASSLVSAP